MSRSPYNFPMCLIFSTKRRNLNSTGLGWPEMMQHSRQISWISVVRFQACKDVARRVHKSDLFRILRKKRILKLVCHVQFLIVLLALCETSEMFLTSQKNNKYLSCNVSLWSWYKFSWILFTIVPEKKILKLNVLVRHFRKIAKSYFVMSVCLSVRME